MTEPPVALLDVNALVALSLTTHVHHGAAHRYLAALPGPWATCPLTESALIRLLLNPRVTTGVNAAAALGVLAGMRRVPSWRFLADASSVADPHVDPAVLVGHNQVTDLHLVNLAVSHGARLATFDAALPTWLAPMDRGHVEVIPA